MQLIYGVGDIVKIVPELESCGDGWVDDMLKWGGFAMTISEKSEDEDYYHMEEDDGEWCWLPEMISELLVPASAMSAEYSVGDRVIIARREQCEAIADRQPGFIPAMDKWCGEVVTIRHMNKFGTYGVEENPFSWGNFMIKGLENEFSFIPATSEELMNLLL